MLHRTFVDTYVHHFHFAFTSFLATNEFSLEVLQSMLCYFDAKIPCNPPHSQLLKEVSARVKVLKCLREFILETFGANNEGHELIDSYELSKVRADLVRWESFISDAYITLRALRNPAQMLAEVYMGADPKRIIKTTLLDLSIIMDNIKIPEGW